MKRTLVAMDGNGGDRPNHTTDCGSDTPVGVVHDTTDASVASQRGRHRTGWMAVRPVASVSRSRPADRRRRYPLHRCDARGDRTGGDPHRPPGVSRSFRYVIHEYGHEIYRQVRQLPAFTGRVHPDGTSERLSRGNPAGYPDHRPGRVGWPTCSGSARRGETPTIGGDADPRGSRPPLTAHV